MLKFAGKIEDKSGIVMGLIAFFIAICSLGAYALEGSVSIALIGIAFIGCSFSKNSIMYYLGLLSFGIVLLGIIILLGALIGLTFLDGVSHLSDLI